MSEPVSVSLVIPLFNESRSIEELITTIEELTLPPNEVILVDGGSTDNTVSLLKKRVGHNSRYKVIEAGRAMPGKGRNIGAEHSICEWIAFTDAGIRLDKNWLQQLTEKAMAEPDAAIVYGNYSPRISNLFEKAAAIAYVPPLKPDAIRGIFIASCLLKKEVWTKVGGFPDWRAAEDLIFMEKAAQLGYKIVTAPAAMITWQLRPTLWTTYKRFDLYSKYNVWAGRQAYWHYGLARQYAFMLVPILLAIFHSGYWLLLIPLWLMARVAKRILAHRYEFGVQQLFNPAVFFMVMLITLVIDTGTFSGWLKAIFSKPATSFPKE